MGVGTGVATATGSGVATTASGVGVATGGCGVLCATGVGVGSGAGVPCIARHTSNPPATRTIRPTTPPISINGGPERAFAATGWSAEAAPSGERGAGRVR